MSFILRKNNNIIAQTKSWHPRYFGEFTNTSYPRVVNKDYQWEDGDFTLVWEEDAPTPTMTPEELQIERNNNIISQIVSLEEKQARAVREAILGKGVTALTELENKIVTLRAGLRNG